MMLSNTATGVMLKPRNIHRDINKKITLCTAIERLTQETLDEVDLS